MITNKRKIAISGLFLILLSLQPCVWAQPISVRPIRDDIGFCWNAESMKKLVLYLQLNERDSVDPNGLVAAIAPHDDYLYAGRVYFPLFHALTVREVVIFGVTHATVRKEIGDPHGRIILDDFSHWQGLYNNVAVSPLRDYLRRRMDSSMVLVSRKAHVLEHSIEAHIPFLQYFNPKVAITPIMITAMPLARMDDVSDQLSDIICRYLLENELGLGNDVFFLISSDANHYGRDFDNHPFGEDEAAHTTAVNEDIGLVKSYLCGAMDAEKLFGLTEELTGASYDQPGRFLWCGRYSIPFGAMTVEKVMQSMLDKSIRGRLIRYSDTYSEGVLPIKKSGMGITAPFSLKHWVGFFSLGYYVR